MSSTLEVYIKIFASLVGASPHLTPGSLSLVYGQVSGSLVPRECDPFILPLSTGHPILDRKGRSLAALYRIAMSVEVPLSTRQPDIEWKSWTLFPSNSKGFSRFLSYI